MHGCEQEAHKIREQRDAEGGEGVEGMEIGRVAGAAGLPVLFGREDSDRRASAVNIAVAYARVPLVDLVERGRQVHHVEIRRPLSQALQRAPALLQP